MSLLLWLLLLTSALPATIMVLVKVVASHACVCYRHTGTVWISFVSVFFSLCILQNVFSYTAQDRYISFCLSFTCVQIHLNSLQTFLTIFLLLELAFFACSFYSSFVFFLIQGGKESINCATFRLLFFWPFAFEPLCTLMHGVSRSEITDVKW